MPYPRVMGLESTGHGRRNWFTDPSLLRPPRVIISFATIPTACPILFPLPWPTPQSASPPHSPAFYLSPVHCNGCHRVDAGKHRCDGKEVLEAAVVGAKVPFAVKSVDEIDQGVEGSHGGVGESQVYQEIVGDGPHALVGQDDPDNDEVSKDCHSHHQTIGQRPKCDPPGRLHELVREVGPGLGRCLGCHRQPQSRKVASLELKPLSDRQASAQVLCLRSHACRPVGPALGGGN